MDDEATGWILRGPLPNGSSAGRHSSLALSASRHQFAKLSAACNELATAAGELATKHIYLDPHDPAEDTSVRAYCALCMRYGLNSKAVDHAESCLVGRVALAIAAYSAQVAKIRSANPTERTSVDGSKAPAEQEGAAAEGLARALAIRGQEYSTVLRVEYLAENPRDRYNPYAHPCPAARGSVVCEMENGHSGAHCSDGNVWADDGTVWADRSWRLA